MGRSDPTLAFKPSERAGARMATPASASSFRRIFERACHDIEARGVVEGALLISRDGFPLAGRAPGVDDPDVFAAMHATALGAAEVALAGLGAAYGVTVVAEHGDRKFVSRGVTPSLFVVACVRGRADCAEILAWMDGLAEELAR
jgi:predicted regulator of Ras-like GTPase activity (Roadblock/LC7/MglB family)